jgi:hypothetical protein
MLYSMKIQHLNHNHQKYYIVNHVDLTLHHI